MEVLQTNGYYVQGTVSSNLSDLRGLVVSDGTGLLSNGLAGADTLVGTAENDTLSGGTQDDLLDGDAGADTLSGDDGADTLMGNEGADTLLGGDDSDLLDRGGGDDSLSGGSAADTLIGGEGSNTLDGGASADQMIGGSGDDRFVVNFASDVVVSGGGTDTVQASIDYTLADDLVGLALVGAAVNGTGNAGDNIIFGNTLDGAGGADTLLGALGDDMLVGGEGADSLDGSGGADTMDGGAGDDALAGGNGSDRLNVDNVLDVVIELASEGNDVVVSTVSWTLGANLEQLTMTGTADITGTGNELANRIAGNAGANLLAGLSGNDNLIGGDGTDTLLGGAGRDALTGGTGADWFLFENPTQGVDRIVDFTPGADLIAIEVAAFGGGLVAGALDPANFVAHASNAATSAGGTPQFIHNTSSGVLSFDADGASGAAALRLAVLTGAPTLAETDFFLV
ncbi:MAG TPA: calcium-binding protein [Falsiroseomonas sp.]|jgi:Ca2+-binding RTX toxin-like protein|nr:calcium-binding protein [Falsiroseomonas sp.]